MSKPYLFLFLTCWHFTALAQGQRESGVAWKDLVAQDMVTVESVSGKTHISSSGPEVRRYTGGVKLRHQGVLLFCDRAIHQVAANSIRAYGHVLIVQEDSVIIKSDSLLYDGVNRQAILSGRVVFQDRRTVLSATHLNYNLLSGIARYTGKGRFVDGRTILTSLEGWYSTRTRQLAAYQQVRLVTPLTTQLADSLRYSPATQLASISPRVRAAGGNIVMAQAHPKETNRRLAKTQPTVTDNAPRQAKLTTVGPTLPTAAETSTAAPIPNDQPSPARFALTTASPSQSPKTLVEQESGGRYTKAIRFIQPPVETARIPVQADTDASDLERVLNRKRQIK